MSFADEGEWESFFGRDHLLPAVTPEAVSKALQGFPLPLADGRDMEWLATAVRRALGITLPSVSDGPKRTSNADVRTDLTRLADLAGSTWQELFKRDSAVESQLWWFALSRWDGEGGAETGDGIVLGDPSEHLRFMAAIRELEWLASFLREAAKATPSQKGPWRQSLEKRLRIERGQYLAPIFEAAFNQIVSANNFPTDARIKAQTPFMDFYGRMVALAFGARETANLTEIVKAACRLHRQHPVKFAEGLIPKD